MQHNGPGTAAAFEHDALFEKASGLLESLLMLDGVALRRQGWFGRRKALKAIGLLERVMEINPANWPALWLIGKAYQSMGDPQTSLEYFTKSLALAPDQPDVAREAGIAALDSRRPDLAIEFATRAIAASPDDAGLQANLALAHLFAGSPARAKEIADDALARDPSDDVTRKIVKLIDEVLAGRRPCPAHLSEC